MEMRRKLKEPAVPLQLKLDCFRYLLENPNIVSTTSLAFLELLHYNRHMDIREKLNFYFQIPVAKTTKLYIYIYIYAQTKINQ
jgi:hypothetical protein